MKKLILPFLGVLSAFGLPFPAFAAVCAAPGVIRSFRDIICLAIDLIDTAIPIVAGMALLVFFWGLAKFILKADDEDAREEGKQVMKWGIIALFVMVSIWGIVSYLQADIFGVSTQWVPQLPIGTP